jgi:NAD(P)-dependent dehydrogenase (short-subunit alcohol dehydrogenase family)
MATSAFTGSVAVVTGGASGIGAALCHELLARGATVYAADRDSEGLSRLGEPAIHTHQVDVTDEGSVSALLDRVVAEQGRIDYLFNNAGIVVGGDFEHMDPATWAKVVDVNIWGVVHGTQHGYAQMLAQRGGHIINTASSAGVLPVARSTAYATTKHAVVGLSVSLREEARRHGVRVSVVIPGVVDTGIFDSAVNLGSYDYQRKIDKLPMGRLSPQRAARFILDGTAKNRSRIVFPFHNRVIVTLHRLAPALMGKLINANGG